MKTDLRVSQTEKFGHSGAIRTVINKEILYAYYTVVAFYDNESGTMWTTDHFWSKTTVAYINKFRRSKTPKQEISIGQDQLEEQVYSFLAEQAKNRQSEEIPEGDMIDEVFGQDLDSSQKSAAEEMLDRAAEKAPIKIKLGTPVIFIR